MIANPRRCLERARHATAAFGALFLVRRNAQVESKRVIIHGSVPLFDSDRKVYRGFPEVEEGESKKYVTLGRNARTA